MLTADELRQIKRLHVQLNRKVNSPFAGEYRSAFRGLGMEFEEVRPYLPGDDIRHIDWNVTARTGHPHIKQFREERELTLMLVMDVSGSMGFGGGGDDGKTDKRAVIARLAGALAYSAIRNGDRVGLLAFSDQTEHYLPPRKSRGHAWAVIRAAYAQGAQGRRTDMGLALEEVGRSLRRRAVVCVLSDFLSAQDGGSVLDARAQRALGVLARRHHLSCFLVNDPLEYALPSVGLVELVDSETGQRQLVDSARVQPSTTVEQRVHALRRRGARVAVVGTDMDPFHQLICHFRALEHLR